jgi:uncharacterized protein (TIGR03083 family)
VHLLALRRDGELLAAAADRAGLTAAVPSCPGWQVRDLLRHIGYVHRWAAEYVVEQRQDEAPELTEAEQLRSGPGDDQLIDWFRAGHAALLGALGAAAPDLACWTFLSAPTPRAFWARRQAHETAIHRADAELASGAVAPFDPEFATDGIDELVCAFLAGNGDALPGQQAGGQRRLEVRTTDTAARWQLTLAADGAVTGTARLAQGAGADTNAGALCAAAADCTLTGPASALYLVLWNRIAPAAADVLVSGDSAAYQTWRDGVRLTWQ